MTIQKIILVVILCIISNTYIYANTETIIINKKSEIVTLNTELLKLNSQISSLSSQKYTTETELKKVETDIANLTKSISELENNINVKLDEIKNIEGKLGKKNEEKMSVVSDSFVIGNIQKNEKANHLSSAKNIFIKNIQEKILSEIDLLNAGKVEIDNIILELSKTRENIQTSVSNLTKIKSDIAKKIAETNANIGNIVVQKEALRSKINKTNAEVAMLEEEQRIALKKEQDRLAKLKEEEIKRQQEIAAKAVQIKGEFYISGRGRDLQDGHAVGMSQWGAYGAGFAGFKYDEILKKYYTGVIIKSGFEGKTVRVSGYGSMNIEDYLAGLGEIPSSACENATNIGKPYVVKNTSNNDWDCWPEETIKAQIVAARSYILANIANNPNWAVPTDDTFQVYAGGKSKKWAADATRGQVLVKVGESSPITALYSSSFRGHSEDNELFFNPKSIGDSLNELKGTPYSYLRGIDDSSWAYKNETYNFNWKTKSFSLAKFKEMLKYSGLDYGDIKEIVTYKGSSSRVWAVKVVGSKSAKYMTGWKFKQIVNDWMSDKEKDATYIYSTEFDIFEVK